MVWVIVAIVVIVGIVTLLVIADRRRMTGGSGTWVKSYETAGRFDRDAQQMAAHGWTVVSQSTDHRKRIVMTWQRAQAPGAALRR